MPDSRATRFIMRDQPSSADSGSSIVPSESHCANRIAGSGRRAPAGFVTIVRSRVPSRVVSVPGTVSRPGCVSNGAPFLRGRSFAVFAAFWAPAFSIITPPHDAAAAAPTRSKNRRLVHSALGMAPPSAGGHEQVSPEGRVQPFRAAGAGPHSVPMFRVRDFSRLTRVTIKTLRHYDRLGLLKPVFVDPETRYRHYSAQQVVRLHRIRALRELGFSLAQIGELLGPGPGRRTMRRLLERRRDEIAARRKEDARRLVRSTPCCASPRA